MEDVEAIKQLKARYFRTMDTKDWAGMRQVFSDDVTMDTSAAGGGVITGADEFMAFLEVALADAITVHHGHMPEIELHLCVERGLASGRSRTPSSGPTAAAWWATGTTTRPMR